MTGYVRADTANDIADGKIIDAADLDAEFDAVEAAFDNSTGHTHDGTSAEGAPIEVIGPAQEFLADSTALYPKTDDTYDIGKVGAEYRNLYIDGTAFLDAVDIDGGAIDGTAIGATTPSTAAFTTLDATGIVTIELGTVVSTTTLPLTLGGTGSANASDARSALGLVIGTDVEPASTYLTDIAALDRTDGNFVVANGTTWVAESGSVARASLGLGSMSVQDSGSVTITGGSIAGITDLAVADGGTGSSTASGARTALGVALGSDVQAFSSFLDTLSAQSEVRNTDIATGTIEIDKIASSDRTGVDGELVSGTAGSSGVLGQWNADGDLVSGPAYGTGANELLQLNGSSEIPAVSGANLTNLPQGLTPTALVEITSDDTALTQTGLSGYSDIFGDFAVNTTTGGEDIILEARVSGGTWRTLITRTHSASANDLIIGSFRIANFNNANSSNVRFTELQSALDANAFDRSDNEEEVTVSTRDKGYSSYNEVWDEVRIRTSTGGFEGDTADSRSIMRLLGN